MDLAQPPPGTVEAPPFPGAQPCHPSTLRRPHIDDAATRVNLRRGVEHDAHGEHTSHPSDDVDDGCTYGELLGHRSHRHPTDPQIKTEGTLLLKPVGSAGGHTFNIGAG